MTGKELVVARFARPRMVLPRNQQKKKKFLKLTPRVARVSLATQVAFETLAAQARTFRLVQPREPRRSGRILWRS